MERNTATTFGMLNEGDRFYFITDKKRIVYEVTKAEMDSRPFYNRINAYGYKMLLYDMRAPDERQIIFLRHKTEI